jgi:hypothetical protein
MDCSVSRRRRRNPILLNGRNLNIINGTAFEKINVAVLCSTLYT